MTERIDSSLLQKIKENTKTKWFRCCIELLNFLQANHSRLKDYIRLDASVVYKFTIGGSLKSEIGASVWNLLNRENNINDYYRLDQTDAIRQFSRFSLGTTANFVARVFF